MFVYTQKQIIMYPIHVELNKDPRRIDMEGTILVAHQPEFLPYLGNISKATMGDVYFILDTVQFVKEHWQSHNKIRISASHEGWQWLIVPLKGVQKHVMMTNEVEIDGDFWKKKHLKSISLSYSRAPFFKEIFPEITGIYERKHIMLIDFLMDIIRYAFKKFDIKAPIYQTSNLKNMGYTIEGKKSELILNMCKVVDAKTFVFGRDGRTYIEKEVFYNAGINFVFQEFHHMEYTQIHGHFVPNMSFIDLLFNYGPESKSILGKCDFALE